MADFYSYSKKTIVLLVQHVHYIKSVMDCFVCKTVAAYCPQIHQYVYVVFFYLNVKQIFEHSMSILWFSVILSSKFSE